ncbi:DUF4911 domain-containing protein [Desulfobotulus sp.]|uniref:DUF4911 domain-containing protein n=1 Tax=Desulfobotulus sp. TaxID=1940337 RepID=UPI002A36575A|nr:DUF4911 domain-containing protein [Desulfobotulus sp.]MDY0162841.1 DUF4911 domain-containing protein [Desulfobotulus sp.]
METESLFFRMDRKEIGYLRFLLEAYEGMAALSTLDREQGVVMVRMAPGCAALVEEVIASFGPEAVFIPLSKAEVTDMGFSTELCA